MKSTVFGLLMVGLCLPASLSANDTAFGGQGADVMPIKTPEVEMVREHIVIQADDTADSWSVKVDFEFKNVTDKPVALLMGFPFHVNSDESDLNPPKGAKYPEANDPLVWDFKTTLRGKKVTKMKRQELVANKAEDLHYRFAYVWDVKFAPGETIKVMNSYRIGMTASSMGSLHGYYTLKTGGLWHGGKIGRSQIEVHGVPGMVPCWNENFGQITPAGYTKKPNKSGGMSFYWDLKNHKPTKDVEVCYHLQNVYREMNFYELEDTNLKELNKKELRVLRNTVFAQHGYVFKSKDLREHFAKQPWYQANPKFNNSDLSAKERAFVNKVKKEEKSR